MVHVVVEYNDKGYLVYAIEYPGAAGRGQSKEEALAKLRKEIQRYLWWSKQSPLLDMTFMIVQESKSKLHIEDADTEVLCCNETEPLSLQEYEALKALVVRSAYDFQGLYDSIPKKLFQDMPSRKTFYGMVCRTPKEMYEHTNDVTAYYFGEVGVKIIQYPLMLENRIKGFEQLEQQSNLLSNAICIGHNGEQWCVRKVLRRFLWHDAIHAKAMYRLARKTWNKNVIVDSFGFELLES